MTDDSWAFEAPPWQPTRMPPQPLPVLLLAAPRATAGVSRLRVLVRLLLAIPHLVVMYALGIAADLVAVVAWFAALFTGRVPDGIYGFLGWVVAYATRVNAYLYLLTDQWPTFGDEPFPVVTLLPGPDRLNRVAVFFRLILMIPAALLGMALSYGVLVAAVVVWLIVLVAGRVPVALFNALASILRYQTRYYAYAAMLTAAYPGGVFGDSADRDPVAALPQPAAGEAAAPAVLDSPAPPRMTGAARGLVAGFVALGALACVGWTAVTVVGAASGVSRARADIEVNDAYRSLDLASSQDCSLSTTRLDCLRGVADRDARSVQFFSGELQSIRFPHDVRPQVVAVQTAAATFAGDMRAMARAGSIADYVRTAASEQLPAAGQQLDQAVAALRLALHNG